jgi:3-hydroxyacyl-CoA dehydrogenase
VPEDTPKREIKQVAVIGAGTMGGGIAMNFLNAGIPVTMLEMKQEALDKRPGHHPQELRSTRSRRAS